MRTIAFVMAVHPEHITEYIHRHQPIWPELTQTLQAHGVMEYSIFLHPGTYQLFAVAKIQSQEQWDAIAETDVCRRWWAHMAPLMPTNPDDSPIAAPLESVFDLEH